MRGGPTEVTESLTIRSESRLRPTLEPCELSLMPRRKPGRAQGTAFPAENASSKLFLMAVDCIANLQDDKQQRVNEDLSVRNAGIPHFPQRASGALGAFVGGKSYS
jgi:hypothetical protein